MSEQKLSKPTSKFEQLTSRLNEQAETLDGLSRDIMELTSSFMEYPSQVECSDKEESPVDNGILSAINLRLDSLDRTRSRLADIKTYLRELV